MKLKIEEKMFVCRILDMHIMQFIPYTRITNLLSALAISLDKKSCWDYFTF